MKKEQTSIKKVNNGVYFPLLFATRNNHEFAPELLISNGADVNARDDTNFTALMMACESHCEEMVSFLIRKGADVSAMYGDDFTPFFQLFGDESEAYDLCKVIMIKEFAKLVFENHPIAERDMYMLHNESSAAHHFEKCMKEILQMANSKFYKNNSYYSLLKMSMIRKKLANLTKNTEYVSTF